jgi:lipopolysaccharide transport system ATP-binding protein
MSAEVLVEVDGVSKKFCRSLKRSMLYGILDMGRSFFAGSRPTRTLRRSEFWAVDNVSLRVSRGDCLGVVGHNGAGKSTLLKMLHGILHPDVGRIVTRGRVGALIEVGAGFHPMLTGRENIYVNGAILGMSKAEIDRKFDAIVDFADIPDALDTPVKFYSSGMFVRLGFAIAAHLEPDVLLIDEVLAVGDISFRAKCYEAISRMRESSAIIFVSHSMPHIARLSSRVAVFAQGRATVSESVAEGISDYLGRLPSPRETDAGSGRARLRRLFFLDERGDETRRIEYGKPFSLRAEVELDPEVESFHTIVHFFTQSGEPAAEISSIRKYDAFDSGAGKPLSIMMDVHEMCLSPGRYSVSLIVLEGRYLYEHVLWKHMGWELEVTGTQVGAAPLLFPARIRVES